MNIDALRVMNVSSTCVLLATLGLLGCSSETSPLDAGGPLASGLDAGGLDASSQPDSSASLEAAATEAGQPEDGARLETGSAEAALPEAAWPEGGAAQSDVARDTNPAVADADKTALSDGMSAFAFDLFAKVNDATVQAKNFACSPVSVSLALGMAYAGAGAASNTAAQFRSVLHVTQDRPVFFKSLDWLSLALGGRAAQARAAKTPDGGAGPNPDDFRLHIVNSIWGDRTLALEKPFLDTLAADFGAGMYLADFRNQPDAERLRINAWVSEETLNRINDLLPAGSIGPQTRTVLVNALHLKLPWNGAFEKNATKQAPFTLAGGTVVDVPLMTQDLDDYPYSEDALAQAVALPLAGRAVHLVLFVPKAGASLAQLEGASLASEIQSLTSAAFAASKRVIVSLPRFKFTIDSTSLVGPLGALGLADAFGGGADFSGITKEPLFITDVVHKAMVGVQETGVEAAAATAIVFGYSARPPVFAEVKADHPFFFGIYDKPTATWLFLGHMVDPSQGDAP